MVLINTTNDGVIQVNESRKPGTVTEKWAKALLKANPKKYKLAEPVAKKAAKPVEEKKPVEAKEAPENTASISEPVEPPKKRGRRPTKKS